MEKQIFDSMIGIWSLTRNLGRLGQFKGVARFVLVEDNSILYREDITLNIERGNYKVAGCKEYKYVYEGGGITKFFVEEAISDRIFYRLSFSGDFCGAQGCHVCGQDIYKAQYEFNSDDYFKIIYEVKGPYKDYIISSTYERLGFW